MFIKQGVSSLKKEAENAHGDCILTKRYKNSDKIIAVLSDGLGSGIKANILAKMTSVMLLKFAEENADLIKASEIVMNSLPVCKVRNISYSTFSIAVTEGDDTINIIEEGNPDFLWIRNKQILNPIPEIISSKTHKDRHLKVYKLKLQMNDTLIFVSDGVTQAGLGSKRLKEGLKREGLIEIALNSIELEPGALADKITFSAKCVSEDNKAHDDISALVLRVVEPKTAVLFTGPPYNKEQDRLWANMFEEFKGKKAVSGGSTAKILSRELKKELILNQNQTKDLPSTSFMEGADLVTEGILTLNRTAEYLDEEIFDKKDAALELAKFLLEADILNFIIGANVNIANFDPNLPAQIALRKDVTKKIAKILREKYLKKVNLQYL